MPRNPATPKKHATEQALSVSSDATNKSSSKAEADKPQALESQKPASRASTMRRRGRLAKSDTTQERQLVDLTRDDSDSPPADRKSAIKAAPQATTNATSPTFCSQRRDIRQAAPSPTPASLNLRNTMDGNDFATMSGLQASPSERPAKRARVEDGMETNIDRTIENIDQYHLAPPEPAAGPIWNMPTTGSPGLPVVSAFNRDLLPFHGPPRPIFELEALPTMLATLPTPETPAENTATLPTPSTTTAITNPAATKPAEEAIKAENGSTDHKPTTSTPTLKEKIEMARELGLALGIPERDAYQLLMGTGWVGDDAVLAYLGTKVEGGK